MFTGTSTHVNDHVFLHISTMEPSKLQWTGDVVWYQGLLPTDCVPAWFVLSAQGWYATGSRLLHAAVLLYVFPRSSVECVEDHRRGAPGFLAGVTSALEPGVLRNDLIVAGR